MALTFFEPLDDSQGMGNLLFLNEWLKENPKNKTTQFVVNELKLARSKKGYVVTTSSFMVFIWKNSKVTTMLVEALKHWVEQKSGLGYNVYVVLDPKAKEGYRLAADKEQEVTWFASGNDYTTTEPPVISVDTDQNIFL